MSYHFWVIDVLALINCNEISNIGHNHPYASYIVGKYIWNEC